MSLGCSPIRCVHVPISLSRAIYQLHTIVVQPRMTGNRPDMNDKIVDLDVKHRIQQRTNGSNEISNADCLIVFHNFLYIGDS